MTEHKFTDDEIIRALERCTTIIGSEACEDCPMQGKCREDCDILEKSALDLVNRQRANLEEVITLNSKYEAEIERLERDLKKSCELIECWQEQLDRVKDAYGIRVTTALEAITNVHMLTLKKYLDTGEQYVPE